MCLENDMETEKKDLEQLYQFYDQLLNEHIEILCDLQHVQEEFQSVLESLDQVTTREDLQEVEESYQEAEENLEDVTERVEGVVEEEDQSAYGKVVSEVEEESFLVSESAGEKEETILRQEQVVMATEKGYDALNKESQEVLEEVQSHRRKIQEYLKKIDQIKAREITVYRSRIVNKSLRFASKLVRRSVEAKVLSTVVPKKMAQLYLATKVVQDAKKLMQEEDLTITRKEVDVSYYDEMRFEQASIKGYDDVLKGSLMEIRKLKDAYKKNCQGFPDGFIYQENMKQLDQLEDVLLQEALQVEELVQEYDQAMDLNEQKIKVLKGD